MKQKLKFPLERTYIDKIAFQCPVRGWVVQEVEVHVYSYRGTPEVKKFTIEIDGLDDLDCED